MSLLHCLNKVISVEILSQWCELKDVMEVDLAFCSKTERIEFYNKLQCAAFICHSANNPTELKYIYKHQIKVFQVVLNDIRGIDHVDHWHINITKLESVHLDLTTKFVYTAQIQNFINCFIHLKVLTIDAPDDLTDIIIQSVSSSILSQLTSFTKHFMRSPATGIEHLSLHCKNLTKLHMTVEGREDDAVIELVRNNTKMKSLWLEALYPSSISLIVRCLVDVLSERLHVTDSMALVFSPCSSAQILSVVTMTMDLTFRLRLAAY